MLVQAGSQTCADPPVLVGQEPNKEVKHHLETFIESQESYNLVEMNTFQNYYCF